MRAIAVTIACSMTGGLLLLFACTFLLPFARLAQRSWSRLYTCRLPSELRDAKRDDDAAFSADLEAHLRAQGYKPEQVGLHILANVMRGARHNITWRWDIATGSLPRWTRRDKQWAAQCVLLVGQGFLLPAFVWEQFGSPARYFPLVLAATAVSGINAAIASWGLWRWQRRVAALFRGLRHDEQAEHEENR